MRCAKQMKNTTTKKLYALAKELHGIKQCGVVSIQSEPSPANRTPLRLQSRITLPACQRTNAQWCKWRKTKPSTRSGFQTWRPKSHLSGNGKSNTTNRAKRKSSNCPNCGAKTLDC